MSDFNEIESLFDKLLFSASHVLSKSEVAEINSFIDVGEYGIALETAVDIFVEEGKIAPDEVVSLVKQLAIAMSIEPTSMIDKLVDKGGR